jgi:hypothetical protein
MTIKWFLKKYESLKQELVESQQKESNNDNDNKKQV